MKLIERKFYLDRMINVLETPDIKVITGVRRSGKSKLLESFKKYLIDNVENCNLIHINYNLTKYEFVNEYHKLIEYVNSKYVENTKNFLLIDEIQMCEGFEKAINNFHTEEKYNIYNKIKCIFV